MELACASGHVAVVTYWIRESREDINQCNDKGESMLQIASREGQYEVVKVLLENKADANLPDNFGWVPLMVASEKGHTKIVRELLENGAIVNPQDGNKWSALTFASMNGHSDIVKMLLKNDALVEFRDSDGHNALVLASMNGHCEVVKILIENGAAVDYQDKNQRWSPLISACKRGNYEVTEVLLEHRANMELRDRDGLSALMMACENGHSEVAALLLENGAQIDLHDNAGWSALMLACQSEHSDVVRTLLVNNTPVDTQIADGRSALMIASQKHKEITKILLENGANVNLITANGGSALILASKNGQSEIVKMLLENGAEVDLQDIYGWSALIIACLEGEVEVVDILLQNNAQVNLQMSNGMSALMVASQNGHVGITRMLLDHGASLTQKNQDGWSALKLATENKHSAITEVSAEKMIQLYLSDNNEFISTSASKYEAGNIDYKFCMQDNNRTMALLIASENGLNDTVETLIENGAYVDMLDKNGLSPLMRASFNGHKSTVEALIKSEAQIDMQMKNGDTALILACMKKQYGVIKTLLENGAQVNLSNKSGCTALMAASINWHDEILKYFFTTNSIKGSILNHIIEDNDKINFLRILQEVTQDDLRLEKKILSPNPIHGTVAKGILTKKKLIDAKENSKQNEENNIPKLLLERGARADMQDNYGWNAFILACMFGEEDIAYLLLKNHTPIVTKNWYPLIWTSYAGCHQITRILLNYSTFIDVQDEDGCSALMHACAAGHLNLVKSLVENGASINLQTKQGYTALKFAIAFDHPDIVRILLQNGAHDNDKVLSFTSLLYFAIKRENEKLLEGAINSGVDVNIQAKDGMTPLVFACIVGNVSAVRRLADIADVNMQNKTGKSALMCASANRKPDIVTLLIYNNADINLQDENGMSALMYGSAIGNTLCVQTLIRKSAKIDLQDKQGKSALMHACAIDNPFLFFHINDVSILKNEPWPIQHFHEDIIHTLIEEGAQIDLQDDYGCSALMFASRYKRDKIVKILLGKKSQTNLQDINGRSALIIASWHGNHQVVETLVQAGAQINQKANNGWTALISASFKGQDKVVDKLLKSGAEISMVDKKGRSALMVACWNGKENVVKTLLENGARVNLRDNDGWTALIYASVYQHAEVVDVLLNNGADIEMETDNGINAFSYAVNCNNKRIIEAMVLNGAEKNVNLNYNTIAATLPQYSNNDDANSDESPDIHEKQTIRALPAVHELQNQFDSNCPSCKRHNNNCNCENTVLEMSTFSKGSTDISHNCRNDISNTLAKHLRNVQYSTASYFKFHSICSQLSTKVFKNTIIPDFSSQKTASSKYSKPNYSLYHNEGPSTATLAETENTPCFPNYITTVSGDNIEKAIKSLPVQSPSGWEGLSFQLLKCLTSKSAGKGGIKFLDALTLFVNMVLSDKLPPEIKADIFEPVGKAARNYDVFYTVFKNIFTLLAAKSVLKQVEPRLTALLAPHQLEFDVPLGAEAMVHSARIFLNNLQPGQILIKLIFKNIFSCLQRHCVVATIKEYAPELLPFVSSSYDSPLYTAYIGKKKSYRGLQHGDPSSCLLVALTVNKLTYDLKSDIKAFHLNTGIIGGNIDKVCREFDKLKHQAKKVGLEVDFNKSELIHLEGSLKRPHGLNVIHVQDTNLLGCPIGKKNSKRYFFTPIKTMRKEIKLHSSHYALCQLKNIFSLPKLMFTLRCTPSDLLDNFLHEFDKIQCSMLSDIINKPLNTDDLAWIQATLPVRYGGLGIKSAVRLAPSAFLASASASYNLIHKILPESLQDCSYQSFDDVSAVWKKGHDHPLPTSRGLKSWEEPHWIKTFKSLMNSADKSSKIRISSATMKESGAWLTCIPSSTLKMSDESVRIGILLRLGINICPKKVAINVEEKLTIWGYTI